MGLVEAWRALVLSSTCIIVNVERVSIFYMLRLMMRVSAPEIFTKNSWYDTRFLFLLFLLTLLAPRFSLAKYQ
jgi:hypothetical protein